MERQKPSLCYALSVDVQWGGGSDLGSDSSGYASLVGSCRETLGRVITHIHIMHIMYTVLCQYATYPCYAHITCGFYVLYAHNAHHLHNAHHHKLNGIRYTCKIVYHMTQNIHIEKNNDHNCTGDIPPPGEVVTDKSASKTHGDQLPKEASW